MTEKRKVQVEASVSADTSGFDAITQGAQVMAEAVQQAGQQAAQGLGAISQSAAPAAEALDTAQRKMQASVQRTIATMKAGQAGTADYFEALARSRNIDTKPFEAYIAELRGVEQAQRAARQASVDASKADAFVASMRQQAEAVGKTRAELLALQAAELGITDKVAPYIQKLREADQGQVKLGMSAAATAAAMRGVPAQFTDIVTSIQGGQKPITVLLQQGGQLKDMFGGIGPAARALGTYILGLVNPWTLAAGAAAALGGALVLGAREHEAYQRALITTGNAAGVTASQLADMARALGSGKFTQSEASSALAEIVKSSGAAADQVQRFTAVSIEMERASGQAISKTAAQFKELEEAPLAASVKLNAEIHHLTAALYDQIKALDEQGRHQDAARVATEAYADALEKRSKQIIANNGFLVTSWDAVSLAIRKAGNALLDFGRDATGSEQLASLKNQLAIRQERGPMRPQDPASVAAFEAGNKALSDQIGLIEKLNQHQVAVTQEQAKQNRALQDKTAWDAQGVQLATKEQKLKLEITKAETEGQALIKAGLLTEEQLRTRIAQIREKYKDTSTGAAGTGQNEVAAIQARVREQQQYLKQLQEQAAGGPDPTKLSEGAKKVHEIEAQLQTDIKGAARAEKERALAAAQSLAVIDQQVLAQERLNKGTQEGREILARQAEAAGQQADTIRQQAAGQEAANAAFGKSKTAIEQLVLSQLQLQAAEADSFDNYDPRYVAALNAKVEAQTRYVAALQEAANKQATLSNKNLADANQRDADLLQEELSLAGQTQEARERIVEQRRIELDYAKKIADIDTKGLTPAASAARKAEIQAQEVVAASTAAARASLDTWQRTADNVNQSLTDAGVSAFHNIRDAASVVRNEIKSLFDSLVLSPVLKAVTAPLAGALTSIGQSLAGSILGTGAGSAGGGLLAALGLTAAGGATAATASTGLGLLGAGGTAAAGGAAAAGGGGLLGAASGALAAMGPVGWAALAAAAAYAVFSGKGGGPKTEAGAGIGVRTTGDVASVATQIEAIQQQYAGIASGLGGKAGQLDLGIFSAQDPKGTAQTQLAFNAYLNGQSIYSRENRLGGIENVGRTPEALQAAMTEESKRVVLQALQASDIPGQVGDYLRALGDLNGLTGGALDDALQRAQTIGTQRAQLQQRLADLTDTAEQKLLRTREAERDATDELNRALLDQINNVQDLADAVTRSMTSLQASVDAERARVSDSLNAVLKQLDDNVKSSMAVVEASVGAERTAAQTAFNDAMRALQGQIDTASASVSRLGDLADTLHSARASFTADPVTGMQHGEASAAIEAAIAIAKAQGVLPDAKALQSSLDVLSRPSSEKYGSLVEYTRARDRDAADIQALAGLSDDSLSVAQQQLKAAQDQATATQASFDETNARLDAILAQAKAQVDAATGTTVAVMSSNAALAQLLQATGAYTAQFGATQAQLAAENARLDGVLAAAQAQVAMAQGTTVAVVGVQAAINTFNSSLLTYLAARDAAHATLGGPPAAPGAGATSPALQAAIAAAIADLNRAGVTQRPADNDPSLPSWLVQHGMIAPLNTYAQGGAFSGGIVSRPTAFAVGLMGERSPGEVLMPLANIGGSMGVRALPDPSVGELRELLTQANETLRAIALHSSRSAKNTGDLVDRGVTVKTDTDTPLQVQNV